MNCPHCEANLKQRNSKGETLLRTRGIVLKADRLVAVCPKCKGDVPVSPEMMQKMHSSVVLFFRNR
ncbi:MAG TPA: hypothetical protein VFL54_01625 [Gammaproteobacteria bacterium]|nr:hypothetical protein [Gammaproteobacteria bacterium]